MKKIFYFIASAIVALGAVACQNEIEEGIDAGQQTEGFSITANIGDMTRVAVEDSNVEGYDKKLTWEGNETLTTSKINGVSYKFTNTPEAPHTFTCTQDGVEAAFASIEETTFYFNNDVYMSGDYSSVEDNKSFYLQGEYTKGSTSIEMELWYAVFHFTCYEEVTLKYYNPSNDMGQLWGEYMKEYTFSAGEHYVGAYVTNNGAKHTLEAWIDGVKVKSITREFPYSKIYNLGHIEAPTKLYLAPGQWSSDNAWFAAYFFNNSSSVSLAATRAAATDAWAKMTDEDKDGVYECIVPEGFDSVTFGRMNPAKTELSWDSKWNQTVDIELNTEGATCYRITGWGDDSNGNKSTGEWGNHPYAPVTAGVQSNYGLIGAIKGSGWSTDIKMYTTAKDNIFVAENVIFESDAADFKIRTLGNWSGDVNAGRSTYNYLKEGYFFGVYNDKNSANINVEKAGTYDIYFDLYAMRVYLMTPGTDYTTATEQTANGAMPDTSTYSWGLVGTHNSWGTPDIALEWNGTMYVAKNAKLTGEFKVRADSSWDNKPNFGSGGNVTIDADSATTMYNNGGNCKASGTYDVYFWYDQSDVTKPGKIWIKTPGSAAPTL